MYATVKAGEAELLRFPSMSVGVMGEKLESLAHHVVSCSVVRTQPWCRGQVQSAIQK